MDKLRISVLTIIAGVVVACVASAGGSFTADTPTHSEDEVVTISIKNSQGVTSTLTAYTGAASSTADDIPKPGGALSAADALAIKRQKIRDAVNYGPETGPALSATLNSDGTISITTDDPTSQVKSVTIANNTRQVRDVLRVDPSGTGGLEAWVAFQGGPEGLDESGAAASVTVGTKRGEVVVYSENYGSTEALVEDLVDRLVLLGIAAAVDQATGRALTITMNASLDEYLVFGNTDGALAQEASLGQRSGAHGVNR